MSQSLEPVRSESLQDACPRRMEAKILSGEWSAGQRLRPERRLAEELQVSRPVVHQALVGLETRGLVRIVPRRGVFVCDYRTSGSLAVLSTLLAYQNQALDPHLLLDLIETRKLIETETARLAAENRTRAQLGSLKQILAEEVSAEPRDSASLTDLDFQFHLEIALASGNHVYPMILNSFRAVYTRLTGLFFSSFMDDEPVRHTLDHHHRIIEQIRLQNPSGAAKMMADMLDEGARFLLEPGGYDD